MSLLRFRFLLPKAHYGNNWASTCGTKVKPILSSFSPRVDFIFEKKTLAEELGIPAPPKRPLTPYFRYLGEQQQNLSSITNARERIKIVSRKWNLLDESEKTNYYEASKVDFEVYKKKMKEYKKMLSEEQIKEMKTLKEKKKAASELAARKQTLKKESEEMGRPKHPGNAVSLFVKETENPKLAGRNTLKIIYSKWNNLPESSREVYVNRAKMIMEKYQSDLYSWEMKMLEIGRKHLVRRSTIAGLKK